MEDYLKETQLISVLQQALLSILARKGLPGNPFPIVAALLEAYTDQSVPWKATDAQVAASLDGGGVVEVFPPPFAGLARRSDFPHAWGLAHVLPCTSCTGVARQHFHGGASCPSL
eukprot:jgi/Astpho2/3493/Aster-x1153